MITKRDQDILNFIEEFRIANTGQIYRLFFNKTSERYGRHRLQQLFEQGFLKRTRSTISNDFAYFTDRKRSLLQQVHHDLIRTEVFVSLSNKHNIEQWSNETAISNIRPDALLFINDHGISFPFLLEIHLNNKFNFDKYIQLLKNTDMVAVFGLMPRVIICTDRQVTVPKIGIKFKVVGVDMKCIDSILK